MPRYPFYVVIKGKVPGVYQNWTDVAVNIEPRDTSIWQGCASLDEARAIFKRHQDNGTVTATATTQGRIKLDVPLFLSAPPLPISGATRSSGSSSTSSGRTNRSRRRVTVESESESDSEDEEPEELGRAEYAAAMPSGPHTPARGGSRQGTPARGRARAASPTPAAPAPAPATTTPTRRTNAEEERRASHRARRPTARNAEQERVKEGNTRTRPERNRDQVPSGPSAAARERRNIVIKNVFMADTVNVSTSRFCSSRSHAAQGASPPQSNARPPPATATNNLDVHESSSASEDEMFVSPFAQGRSSGSSPDTEIDVELGLDDDLDSGPEAVSEISFMPSPRRPRNPNLQRETSAPASRYGTPLSRQGSGSVTAVSRVHETTRTKTTSHSKSSSSRTETQTQTQRRAPSNVKAEGPGLVIDTGMKRLSLSSSPPTGETQREDGQLPWTWQRPLDVPVPDTDFSISAALRSNKSRSLAGDVEYDIVPTRPNTPPPPPPIVPAATSRSSSQSQRSHRPVPVVAVASIKLCDGCSQPLPSPPLPPPRSMSKSSSESSKASSSVRPCRSCYQPLPSVAVTPTTGRGSGSGFGSSKIPSGSNTMPGSFDEHVGSPAIRTSRSGSGSGSGPRSNASTHSHSRSGSTSTQAPPSPSGRRNALGLAGTGLSSPSSLRYSGAGSDPRSPLGRSDTLSEIGSPRAQMMSFQSLSVLS